MCSFPIQRTPFILNSVVSQQQARLRVSLQNSKVKTMERVETVTVSDFLAMCGGTVGLFIGFSALSVVELIYYPFLRLFWMVQRMKTEKDEKEANKDTANKTVPDETQMDTENQAHSVSNGK